MTFDDVFARADRGGYRPVAKAPSQSFGGEPGMTRLVSDGGSAVRRVDGVLVAAIIGFLLLGIVAVAVAGYLVVVLGSTAAAIATGMALVPLVVVVLVVAWIDRWEPEPRPALWFAVLWGAAASVGIALLFSFGAQIVESLAGIQPSAGTLLFSSVIQAPVVEEFAKGLGVLILFWVYRRQFDGPVDGVVYGAMVAVGFAFTENIQYFGLALTSTDLGGVGETFVLRALLSPFAHVMFTACTGLVLGLASRRRGGSVGYFLLGLVPAILLHAFWNGSASLVTDFYAYYTVVQVPLFLIAIAIVVFLRRREQQITAARLSEYAAAGWFSQGEVALLASGGGRSQGRAWASRNGLRSQFDAFARDATRLAFTRQRLLSGRDQVGARRAESELLERVVARRRALAAWPPLPVR